MYKFLNINKKYEDISNIYNLHDVSDEYIVIKDKELYQIHIYEIIPVNVTNLKQEQKEYIIEKYIEFLKGMNIDFQILIKTSKFSEDEYIRIVEERLMQLDENNNYLYSKYLDNMKNFLKKQEIYVSNYYIIIKILDTETLDINSSLYSIENTGCKLNKVQGKDKIMQFIYENINKIDVKEEKI